METIKEKKKAEYIITDFDTAERIVCLLNKYEGKPPTQNVWGIVDLGKDEWGVALFDECITEPNLDYTYMKGFVRKYKESERDLIFWSIVCGFLGDIMMGWLTLIAYYNGGWLTALIFFLFFRMLISLALYTREKY